MASYHYLILAIFVIALIALIISALLEIDKTYVAMIPVTAVAVITAIGRYSRKVSRIGGEND